MAAGDRRGQVRAADEGDERATESEQSAQGADRRDTFAAPGGPVTEAARVHRLREHDRAFHAALEHRDRVAHEAAAAHDHASGTGRSASRDTRSAASVDGTNASAIVTTSPSSWNARGVDCSTSWCETTAFHAPNTAITTTITSASASACQSTCRSIVRRRGSRRGCSEGRRAGS